MAKGYGFSVQIGGGPCRLGESNIFGSHKTQAIDVTESVWLGKNLEANHSLVIWDSRLKLNRGVRIPASPPQLFSILIEQRHFS